MSAPTAYPTSSLEVPVAVGPAMQIPFDPYNKSYYIVQRFKCLFSTWKALQLNSVYNVPTTATGGDREKLPGYYLVEEGPPTDAGHGIREWDRIYAPEFPEYEVYEQMPWKYPGLAGGSTVGGATSLARASGNIAAAPSIVRTRTFILGVSNRDQTPFTRVNNAQDIPILTELPICSNSQMNLDTYYGAIAKSIASIYGSSNIGNFPDANAGNTLTENDYWAKACATEWSDRLMVVGQSRLIAWKGNLILRETRYVMAQ